MKDTLISKDLSIEGNVSSKGGVKLEGKITGDIDCMQLVVEQGGVINGQVTAEDVTVLGNVEGKIVAKEIRLHSTAVVNGDIFYEGISMEQGSRYEGNLKRTNKSQQQKRVAVGE